MSRRSYVPRDQVLAVVRERDPAPTTPHDLARELDMNYGAASLALIRAYRAGELTRRRAARDPSKARGGRPFEYIVSVAE